jgi:hypothetical protein
MVYRLDIIVVTLVAITIYVMEFLFALWLCRDSPTCLTWTHAHIDQSLFKKITFLGRMKADFDSCCCSDSSDGSVRIRGGATGPDGKWTYGRVEILNDGIWNTYRANTFRELGPLTATVICRTVGFAGGAYVGLRKQVGSRALGALPGDEILLQEIDGIVCKGDENNLRECDIRARPEEPFDKAEDHREDASVACFNSVGGAI